MFCCGLIMSSPRANTLQKKKVEFKRQRAPPSPVWVSKIAVQGRQQDVWGAVGKKSGAPPNKGHPSGSLWTRNKPREPSWHRFTRQDIKKRHRASFQPQSCQWELVSKQTDPSGPQAQGGEKPYSSPLLKAVVKKEKKGKSWNRIWDCFSTLKQQQEHELPTQRGSDGWYRGRE